MHVGVHEVALYPNGAWTGLPSNALRKLSLVVSKHQPLGPAGFKFAEMVTVSEDLLTRSYLHSMHRQQAELAAGYHVR